jgi:predicted SpoU family rRNA methylase
MTCFVHAACIVGGMELIRNISEPPVLDSVDAVIEALGGPMAVVRLTGRSRQSVTNWRAAGNFPPTTFHVMTTALEAAGRRAAPRLWRMDEPVTG